MVASWLGGQEASLAVAAPMALGGHSHKLCLHYQAEVEVLSHWLQRLDWFRYLQLHHVQRNPQLLQYQHKGVMPVVAA